MDKLLPFLTLVAFVSCNQPAGTNQQAGGHQHDSVAAASARHFREHASRDHVLDELQHVVNTKKKEDMTDRELQFHYFTMHDFDKNNMLDGLEIIKALTHSHDEYEKDHPEEAKDVPKQTEKDLENIVDEVLSQDDKNGDGLISFYEFMASLPEEEAVQPAPPAGAQ